MSRCDGTGFCSVVPYSVAEEKDGTDVPFERYGWFEILSIYALQVLGLSSPFRLGIDLLCT